MQNYLRPAIAFALLFTLLTGIAYPLAITGVAQLALPSQANGSLIDKDGKVIGSALIGQNFTADRYFWPRPSVAGNGYDAAASSGSNLGPTSQKLKDRVAAEAQRLQGLGLAAPIPADAVTASGSGLDPDVSPAYALAQIDRVAAARTMTAADLTALVERSTKGRLFGVIGEPRVNVLQLNLALDAVKP